MFFIIFLSMVAWLMIRPYLPTQYFKLILLGVVGVLVFPAAFLPNLISHQIAYNILWPLAGGMLVGEFVLNQWKRLVAFHQRFTSPHKSSSNSKKSNSRPQKKEP